MSDASSLAGLVPLGVRTRTLSSTHGPRVEVYAEDPLRIDGESVTFFAHLRLYSFGVACENLICVRSDNSGPGSRHAHQRLLDLSYGLAEVLFAQQTPIEALRLEIAELRRRVSALEDALHQRAHTEAKAAKLPVWAMDFSTPEWARRR